MSSSARHILIVVNQGMPSGNYMVIMCPPRCQVTPMGGYRTIQSSDWDDGRVTVIRRNTFIIL